jgi:hypothetical protein
MKTEEVYKPFGYGKSINEILYQIYCWDSELSFYKSELNFMSKWISNYPINSNLPNLFEHIQLFVKDISNFENDRNNLLDKIETYKTDLIGQDEKHHFETHNYYLITFQKMAELIFNYNKNYRDLKGRIFEYFTDLISSNNVE